MIIDLNPTESNPSPVAANPAPESKPAATGLTVTAPKSKRPRHGKSRAGSNFGVQGALIVAGLAVATSAQGAVATWSIFGEGAGDPNLWSNTNNWAGAYVPGSSDTAVFNGYVSSSFTVDLGGTNVSVATLLIDSTEGYQFYHGSLGLGSGVQVLQGSHTMDCNINMLGSTNDWNIASGANLVVNGTNSGSTILQKTGDGTLTVNGNLIVNSGGPGTLDLQRGTSILNDGLIETDSLLLTNSAGFLTFNGGTLTTRGGTVNNGQEFVVGASGTTAAILEVQSNAPLVLNNGFTLGANTAAGNQLLLTNGMLSSLGQAYLGFNAAASNNLAVVTGPDSRWTNSGNLFAGFASVANQFVVSDGGVAANFIGAIGYNSTANNNVAVVTGMDSLWTNSGGLYVGYFGKGNQLVVSNGAVVVAPSSTLGLQSSASNNLAVVTGPGSLWVNSDFLTVGYSGKGNQLVVSNDGTVQATNVTVGAFAGSTNNRVTVSGGNLIITNSGGTGTLNILKGTNVLNAGLIQTDKLLLNNGVLSQFEFNGGTLITRGGTVNNGQPFVVGASGTNAATLDVRSGAPLMLNNGFTLGANTAAAGNQLLLTNGGTLRVTGTSIVGTNETASNNLVVISGTGSLWTNSSDLNVGFYGSGNQLVVSNGGVVANGPGYVGYLAGANNNLVTVTGTNSQWRISNELVVSDDDNTNNQLVIRDGGLVVSSYGYIGAYSTSANMNSVLVSDPGSLWRNSNELYVGTSGSGNLLVVSNSGTVKAVSAYVGLNVSSTNNRAIVDGGNLIVTNSGGTGTLNIRHGTNVLNAGLIQTDNLLLNNSAGYFAFNGGTLITGGSTVNNGSPLVVGNGSSPATLYLDGNGFHAFSEGLVISTAGTLSGNGTVAGLLTVQNGGTVMPGNSVGKLVLNSSPVLQGSVLMEISKTGPTLTNDQIQVTASITYGGSLVVSNLGPDALTVGNSFPLFSASSYGGALTGMSLPPLNSGLMWTNQLLLNGSIAVVPQVQPSISGLVKSGTNLVFNVSGGTPGGAYTLLTSTNVALPLSSWTTNSTGNFDWLGNITLTNGINPDEAQRFFNVRVP